MTGFTGTNKNQRRSRTGTHEEIIEKDAYPYVFYCSSVPSQYIFIDVEGKEMHSTDNFRLIFCLDLKLKPVVDTFPYIGGSNATGENAMFLRKRRSSNKYSRQNSILKKTKRILTGRTCG